MLPKVTISIVVTCMFVQLHKSDDKNDDRNDECLFFSPDCFS